MDTARLVECIPANIQTVDKPSAWIPWIFSVDIANLKGSFLFSFDGLLLKATTLDINSPSETPYQLSHSEHSTEPSFVHCLLLEIKNLYFIAHSFNRPQIPAVQKGVK